MSFPEYLDSRSDEVVRLTIQHAEVVAVAILIATLLAVGTGLAVYRHERAAQLSLGLAAVFLTIPSFALLGLLIAPFGLGVKPTLIALVMYALLPILRNTVTGLRGVDAAVLESARGMGMSDRRRLLRVELPLAWPVILTGVRVSTLIVLGIAAIAAAVNGPGLGEFIFRGIGRIGAVNAFNEILAGTLGIMVLALAFDIGFLLVRRATTSGGLR